MYTAYTPTLSRLVFVSGSCCVSEYGTNARRHSAAHGGEAGWIGEYVRSRRVQLSATRQNDLKVADDNIRFGVSCHLSNLQKVVNNALARGCGM